MSTGSGGKPSGSQPGRPAADTPQRLVVRSLDGGDSLIGANDTAVAVASKSSPNAGSETSLSGESMIGSAQTPSAGTSALSMTPDLVGVPLAGRYLVTRQIG